MKKKSKQLQELDLFLKDIFHNQFLPLTCEYTFAPPRRWRFDYCFVKKKVAIEYEGGIFRKLYCRNCKSHVKGGGGFHQSAAVMVSNMEKYNRAALDGWTVLRVCAKTIDTGKAYEEIERALLPKT